MDFEKFVISTEAELKRALSGYLPEKEIRLSEEKDPFSKEEKILLNVNDNKFNLNDIYENVYKNIYQSNFSQFSEWLADGVLKLAGKSESESREEDYALITNEHCYEIISEGANNILKSKLFKNVLKDISENQKDNLFLCPFIGQIFIIPEKSFTTDEKKQFFSMAERMLQDNQALSRTACYYQHGQEQIKSVGKMKSSVERHRRN